MGPFVHSHATRERGEASGSNVHPWSYVSRQFSCRHASTLPTINRPWRYDSFSLAEYVHLQVQCPHSVFPSRLWKFVCGFGPHTPYRDDTEVQLLLNATADPVDVIYLTAHSRVDTRPYNLLILLLRPLVYSPIKWLPVFPNNSFRC